jgi:hypothetical protein
MKQPTGYPTPQQMGNCTAICMETQRILLDTVRHCLDMGGKRAKIQRLKLFFRTASMCQATIEISRKSSNLFYLSCGACARLCDDCANDCDLFPDDADLRKCAETCRRCAECCYMVRQVAA